jgi:hypothetical protein
VTYGRKVALIVALALLFGALCAWAKGTDAGVRQDYGNLAAPWLAVAFIAARSARSVWGGVVLGTLATMVALVGFYLVYGLISDLGDHGLLEDIRLEFRANTYWFRRGLISGPIFGALGAVSLRRRYTTPLIATGVLLVLEPIVIWIVTRTPRLNSAVLNFPGHLPVTPLAVEAATGFVVATVGVVLVASATSRRSAPARP